MSTSLHTPSTGTPAPARQASRRERILGDLGSAESGPTLIVIGGLHGNEPAGVLGLERIFERLVAGGVQLQGRLVGLTGNRAALEVGRRFIAQDLNRAWLPEKLSMVHSGEELLFAEDREIAELDGLLQKFIDEALGTPYALDIHTTSGPGPAFSVVHDTLPNRRFARAMPIPIALGLEEELNGTLTDYLTEQGAVALSVEAGQHDEAISAERAEAAIWIAMDVAGILAESERSEVDRARTLLASGDSNLPSAVEVRYRHGLDDRSVFEMLPEFSSFQHVRAGSPLATEAGEAVSSPISGFLLMPLYQDQGSDGFFVTSPVRPVWLGLSTALRRMHLERWLGRLPGIHAVPEQPGTFLVNRKVARLVARQIFHLLGYRRREHSKTHLVMQRRPEPRNGS